MIDKRTIVISGINLTDSGKLSILLDCIQYLDTALSNDWKIIALVANKKLVSCKNIELVEFPLSKKSWIFRLYYEYIYFNTFSKKIKPYLWLSLQDITPNVVADIKAVYCHNAIIYYKIPFKYINFDFKLTLFTLFYKYLYQINIKKNKYVIVQQKWLKDSFLTLFKVKEVLVAYPIIHEITMQRREHINDDNICFFYPTLPRIFKNVEVICEAVKILTEKNYLNFEVIITFSKDDNKYSKFIFEKYGYLKNIKFIGMLSRDEVYQYYKKVHYLLFPSKLESWGLPISESAQFELPIIVADKPYARESIGLYDKFKLFNPDDSVQLAKIMEDSINGILIYDENNYKLENEGIFTSWSQLFDKLLSKA